jgi:hypothetical protein
MENEKNKIPLKIFVFNIFTSLFLLITYVTLMFVFTALIFYFISDQINQKTIRVFVGFGAIGIMLYFLTNILLYVWFKYSSYFEEKWVLKNTRCFNCRSSFSECEQYVENPTRGAWKLYCPQCKKYFIGDTGSFCRFIHLKDI